VGKGSVITAFGHGLIGPKAKADAESKQDFPLLRCRKGKRLTFRYLLRVRSGNANDPTDVSMSY